MKEQKQFNLSTILQGFLTAFNINHGFIPTLRDLLINPSIVVHNYIEGSIEKKRYKKYFSPGRFFVTILAILSIFAFFAVDTDISDKMIRELSSRGDVTDEKENFIRKKTTDIVMFFLNYPMFGFFLLIIPSTLSTRIVFRTNNYNLAKHLVINIYCFVFIALSLGILSLFFNQEEYLVYSFQKMDNARNNITEGVLWKFEFYNYMYFFIPILYYLYSFKNIFKLSWVSSIFKTLVSLAFSSTIIFFSLTLTIIIILLS